MMKKFDRSIYLALTLTFCTLALTSEARGEQNNSKDAQSIVAQENEDDEKESELPKLQGISKNVSKIAKKITVRIDSPSGSGSGVIFAKDVNKYYVVTAKHVVEKEQDYQIVTEDEEIYEINSYEIRKLRDTDLAILSFSSDEDYQVAAFSDYDIGLNKDFWVFVYGWAKPSAESKPKPSFTVGKVVGKETGIFLVKDDLSLTETNGYELIYTNLSERGMSGGAVLDTSGRVIGIHTSAEGERYRLTNKLQLGFSLGIPIGTFLESKKLQLLSQSRNLEIKTIKERADIFPFSKPNLSREELNSVAANILKPPSSSGTETQWVNYGNQLWRSSRYVEASKAFDKAIAQKTNFHQAFYGKGLALYDLGKYKKASKAFKQAIDLEAKFYPAWYRQSLSLLNLKKYPQALKAIEKTITLKPENTALYALRGEALQNLSQYNDAINSYNKAIARDNNPLILTRRGSIYRILGKYDLALQDLNQAIKFDSRYTEGYINRGLTYYQSGDYQQALINLNHTIGLIDRQDPKAYLARGFIYQQLGEKTQAKADFIRAFNLYSLEKAVVQDGTKINLQADKYGQLSTDFNYVMQLNDVDPNIYFGQGIGHLLLNEKQQAIASLTEAQKLFQKEQDKFGQNSLKKIITQIQQTIKQSNNTLIEN